MHCYDVELMSELIEFEIHAQSPIDFSDASWLAREKKNQKAKTHSISIWLMALLGPYAIFRLVHTRTNSHHIYETKHNGQSWTRNSLELIYIDYTRRTSITSKISLVSVGKFVTILRDESAQFFFSFFLSISLSLSPPFTLLHSPFKFPPLSLSLPLSPSVSPSLFPNIPLALATTMHHNVRQRHPFTFISISAGPVIDFDAFFFGCVSDACVCVSVRSQHDWISAPKPVNDRLRHWSPINAIICPKTAAVTCVHIPTTE